MARSNWYGFAECTLCTIVQVSPTTWTSELIRSGLGANCWIIDQDDHQVLVPSGTAGEWVEERPKISKGYLDNAEKTAAAFIGNPPWLLRGGPGVCDRLSHLFRSVDRS